MASGDAINSSSSNVPATVPLHRPLPDTSKIEAFDGKNFRRWQERVYSMLDMHGVVDVLEKSKPADDATQTQKDFWQHANKVCRHTLLSTLSNDLFDIYSVYKEANKIWESLILKYTAEDAGKQKFVVGNFYKWEMVDDKDIKQQINEYHRLLEELRAEKITLPDEFVAGILIEKLPESWSAYKQQLKHKQKQLSLSDLITHIIIEDTNRKAIQIAKGKEMTAKANLVESHKRSQIMDPNNALSGWTSNSSTCTWYGVSCFKNTVLSLSLPGLGLHGQIPSILFNLTYLQYLDLSHNSFHGHIPLELSHLSYLKFISLAVNNLTGSIPSQLSLLQQLQFLDFSVNNLTGQIPPQFGNFSFLVTLELARNSLSGEIPSELGNLRNLNYLQLSENYLSGEFPISVFNISSLAYMSVTKNFLSGTLPLNIGHSLPNLRFLFLANNTFRGVIPSSLSNASHLESLDLSHNEFHGLLPRFTNTKNLTYLILGSNNFSSTTSTNSEFFDSLANCKKLKILMINSNQLAGELPKSVANLSINLEDVCVASNSFTGRIPQGMGKFQNLESLSFEDNHFSGEIPGDMAALNKLVKLKVQGNNLSGEIPDMFGNFTQLSLLRMGFNQFSGRIPSSIGQCKRLNYLDLEVNNLHGTIPYEISSLSGLIVLSFAGNTLLGSFPSQLNSMKQLQYLDFSGNRIQISLQGNNKLCSPNKEIAENLRIFGCDKGKKKPPFLLPTILAVTAAFVLFMSMFCMLWMRSSQKRKNKEEKRRLSSTPFKGVPQNLSFYDIRAATNNFALENLIGKGGFGFVYKGVFNINLGETTLAVKVLDLNQSKASKSFNAECEALKNVRHRNLVKLITSCSSIDHKGDDFQALVMQFMSNGNLDTWLYSKDEESGSSSLTLLQRLNIAIDIASAMDYLHHDCEPPVVHCDLKPGNVLLDEDMVAHVGDFGLARLLSQISSESTTLGLKGTIGYIPPEYGLGGKASTFGDVYSFGILLLEMFTGKRPTDEMFKEGLSLNKLASAMDENQIVKVVDPKLLNHFECCTQSSRNGNPNDGKAKQCIASKEIKYQNLLSGHISAKLINAKKRGKRRWIFRKQSSDGAVVTQLCEERTITTIADNITATSNISVSQILDAAEQRQAIAVAMASTAAAQAAVASAQAAVEIVRLSQPSMFVKQHYAAITIQTSFRGYLARRALGALKGLVKLQALVRGHNVRRRAKFTLQCMQALVRVQTQLCEERAKRIITHHGSTDSINVCMQSRDDDEAQTVDKKIQAALKREKALADAFSHQIWRTSGEPSGSEGELEENSRWCDDGWRRRRSSSSMYSRNNSGSRASCSDQRDPIKIVEIDTFRPYSNSPVIPSTDTMRSSSCSSYKPQFNSPLRTHKGYCDVSFQSPLIMTPSPTKMKHIQVHSASPRCTKSIYSVPHSHSHMASINTYTHGPGVSSSNGSRPTSVPNYMAATASAKARVRSHSTPRQRA
ncbi:putative LRR receptor-like serine/threonine-protein kinase [Senna tora]|uniref:non-specific serine/threonine protein kinase n=1 Tax=Senna tora TaxID=362788 RepID=A0A834WP45_9FABA|nr:putative LRR receptor-like serine/threonine-protein kinase [Senna tora]